MKYLILVLIITLNAEAKECRKTITPNIINDIPLIPIDFYIKEYGPVYTTFYDSVIVDISINTAEKISKIRNEEKRLRKIIGESIDANRKAHKLHGEATHSCTKGSKGGSTKDCERVCIKAPQGYETNASLSGGRKADDKKWEYVKKEVNVLTQKYHLVRTWFMYI